jgi:hypothetical protein
MFKNFHHQNLADIPAILVLKFDYMCLSIHSHYTMCNLLILCVFSEKPDSEI